MDAWWGDNVLRLYLYSSYFVHIYRCSHTSFEQKMSVSLASKITFKRLCDVLEKVIKARASEKIKILKEFILQCKKEGGKLKKDDSNANISMFPVLRLLLPQCDRKRSSYNLKQKLLTNIYIRVLCLGKSSEDAKKLINYRIPNSSKSEGSDISEIIYSVVRKYLLHGKESYTIDRINIFLDNISKANQTNNSKDELFKELFRQISALELKWLTRIILKDLKLGVGTKKLLQVYHPKAGQCFDTNFNLQKLCDNFDQGKKEINYNIEIFSFFKSMNLERSTIKDASQLFHNNHEYFVQMKFDGERSQIHMKDGIFQYFTRQGIDITNNWGYGKSNSDGFLTSTFSRRLNRQCKSIILDGELMGWDKEKKEFGSKGMSYDVKKLTANSSYQPCFVAYDIILYNDKLLINLPYKERLNILNDAFQDEEGSLIKCQNTIISNSKDLLDIFNKSLQNNEEGIVLKKSDFIYKPNVRNGTGCYKLKAEYSEDLVQDIDLIILGGYYGEGKFNGLINSFMMGVAKMPEIEGKEPTQFFSVVSVCSGIAMEELTKLHSKLEKYWIKDCPNSVIKPKKHLPDLWIRPEHSLILTLRATEIVKTDVFPIGYTLRFPRVIQIRGDKPWYSVCTNTEFLSLIKTEGTIHKLTKRKATLNDIETSVVEKKKKITKSSSSKFEEVFYNNIQSNKNLVPITRLLYGKEICVINGNNEISKENIENKLLLHNAKIVQNPSEDNYCVIVGNVKKAKASNIIQSGKYDVVTIDWYKRIIKKENWVALESFLPWDLLCIRDFTKRSLIEKYDDYYDSYTIDANEESLQRSLKRIEHMIKNEEVAFTKEEGMDKELFENGISPFSIFKQIIGYFKKCSNSTKFKFRFMGGIIKEDIDEHVNYIFIEDNSLLSMKSLEVDETIKKSMKKVINSKWIQDCFRDQKFYSIDEYIVE
ncbi:DNA ligase 4-like [Vespa mandarinia]|uniref:DNA ligase 4-like n=1 Tax=Vespa mandarinia TaxID=7446 RepID=UPI0016137BE8|nr:DNA ligase 4-like [Vespa mandarinia]